MLHWAYDSFFYHIYTLGFCQAPYENDFTSQSTNRLEHINTWISNMKDLGINTLYLGPVFESSSHGYDTADYFQVDRRLGTHEDLSNLIANLHSAGIKVILDGVFNHVGRNFWAFQDVLKYSSNSNYCDWIHGLNFSKSNCYNDPFSYTGWEGHYNLVKLNLNNPYVKEHIFKAVESWISTYNIDGLRLDVAYCIDVAFLKELRNFCKHIRSDFWLLGEVLHGDYRKWANPETLDSVTNYDCYKGLYSGHNDKNYFEIASTISRQFGEYGLYRDFPTYNFADNHDVPRIASKLSVKNHLYPLYAIIMTIPGCPSIYYGSEFGIEGVKKAKSDLPLRPGIDCIRNPESHKHPDLFNAIKQLAAIRKNSHALKYGKFYQVGISNQQLAFVRQSEYESIIVVINCSDQPAKLELFNVPINAHQAIDILNPDSATYQINRNRTIIDNIPSNWIRILKAQ